MKHYQLQIDFCGFKKDTVFEGPKQILDSQFKDASGQIQYHGDLGEGYFEVGKDDGLPFFKAFVEGNPTYFTEVKDPT